LKIEELDENSENVDSPAKDTMNDAIMLDYQEDIGNKRFSISRSRSRSKSQNKKYQ